jgi:hypothetical protein
VFAPYGPLLSRDREVTVDWTPGHDAPVVCVVSRERSCDRIIALAARLAPVLMTSVPSVPGSIRRLSIQGPDGAIVLTPFDGAVLAAAVRRRGAIALLEVLSARAVPSARAPDASVRLPDATVTAPEVTGSSAVRVETPLATLGVFAPAAVSAVGVGEFVGRLLAALAAVDVGPFVPDSLSVDLGTHRLMVRPVQSLATPPRFVAVVGEAERPGLLGRRVERAAQAFREAS